MVIIYSHPVQCFLFYDCMGEKRIFSLYPSLYVDENWIRQTNWIRSSGHSFWRKFILKIELKHSRTFSSFFVRLYSKQRVFQVALVVKNLPPGQCRDLRKAGSIPGSGRSPEGGHGNPLQYSCLENPMDKGAWWATAHRVTKGQTWLKQLSKYTLIPST